MQSESDVSEVMPYEPYNNVVNHLSSPFISHYIDADFVRLTPVDPTQMLIYTASSLILSYIV